MQDLFDNNGAEFSADRSHRYCLWRIWDESLPKVMFIGLNPSTAAEDKNDRTISRVIRFAKTWSFGGVYMLNCFAYVSTDPDQLAIVEDNSENDAWIKKISESCSVIVFAWGAFKIVKQKKRDVELHQMFPEAMCLMKNADGSPIHPLFVHGDTQLIRFNDQKITV